VKNVGIDPQCDGRISVAEPIGNHMDRHTRKPQDRGMDVTQIVQSSVRQQDRRGCAGRRLVVPCDQFRHELRDGVRIQRSPSDRVKA